MIPPRHRVYHCYGAGASGWLVLGIVLQAVVGIIQYNLNVPRWTVPLHVIGSAILTAATGMLWAMRFRRGRSALDRDFDTWDPSAGTATAPGTAEAGR